MTDLLQLEALVKDFPLRGGAALRAVDGVSLEIAAGESLGLIGASGSGKTTLGRLAGWLLRPDGGRVVFAGQELARLSRRELRQLRQRFQPVFQDPWASLPPHLPVGRIVEEGLEIHRRGRADERRRAVAEMLRAVGLDPRVVERLPHEFSGGERQRISIARALILRPRLLILDEPVSSLDVSVRTQILDLLASLRRSHELAFLLVSHDLHSVRRLCDRVATLDAGRLVEVGEVARVLEAPEHPATRSLLEARVHR